MLEDSAGVIFDRQKVCQVCIVSGRWSVPRCVRRPENLQRSRKGEDDIVDKKLKHLEFIQGVVNRLSTNSFLLKGWSVVLVAALFALSTQDSDKRFVFLAFIPVMIFWGLDGYFLWQERLYRRLYNDVRKKNEKDIDFSMDVVDVANGLYGWIAAVFSKTLIPFHGILVFTIIVVTLVKY